LYSEALRIRAKLTEVSPGRAWGGGEAGRADILAREYAMARAVYFGVKRRYGVRVDL